jgi:hypothetical protein
MTSSLFTPEELIPRLIDEFGYPEKGAKLVVGKLNTCNPAIQQAFWEWWQSGLVSEEFLVADYSMERLMREHAMKPIAAFLTLDWLLREPDVAAQSLKRGHDHVIPKK